MNEYFEIAKKNGWWDKPITEEMAKLRLHEEVSEAFVALAKCESRERFLEELADIFILCMSYLGGCKTDKIKKHAPSDEVSHLAMMHLIIEKRTPINWMIDDLLSYMRTVYGDDLTQAIAKKSEFNKTRPHRHGREF